MSYKRSRATYEAELTAEQSPFVTFGTPLPPLDPDVRDDGSYVPVWKQEVRDERGRKRLHGAFTGGWSAGYFNTVGSKEGWTPSTFVSSRTNRRKDGQDAASQQRPEDFMDEEDLRDADEAQKIQTGDVFSGFGTAGGGGGSRGGGGGGLVGLFRVQGETMGVKLLKKMGWKEGQGVGPKIRRRARLDVERARDHEDAQTFLFAPDDVSMVGFAQKTDRYGLGYAGRSGLTSLGSPSSRRRASEGRSDEDDDEGDDNGQSGGRRLGRPRFTALPRSKKTDSKKSGGIGMGVLNDTGSDDEDPYEMGPRISYNRVIGAEKKKKKNEKNANTPVNPSVKSKPAFIPKKSVPTRVSLPVRTCHDGRPPLNGFVVAQEPDPLTSSITSQGKHPPPKVPVGWISSKKQQQQQQKQQQQQQQNTMADRASSTAYVSTADAARASTLDAKARAALLGEKQLPGKSVFDFMSASARERLATATGNTNLPPAKGEIPDGYAMTEEERLRETINQIPRLDKDAAVAALSRGASGGAPYADDEAKRSRYRAYLELQAGFSKALPARPPGMSKDDWLRELHEFFNCARIFKPMTGMMASRFTTSTNRTTTKPSEGLSAQNDGDGASLVSKPPPKPQDPAEEAAKLGMFGQMTRTVSDFYPTRLLCKRFGVKPPAHVQPDKDTDTANGKDQRPASRFDIYEDFASFTRPSPSAIDAGPILREGEDDGAGEPAMAGPQELATPSSRPVGDVVDPARNEALEGQKAGEDVFKAIFGDDSEEE